MEVGEWRWERLWEGVGLGERILDVGEESLGLELQRDLVLILLQ